jgi:hypothetical protein
MADPDTLRSQRHCIGDLSKNVDGQALVVSADTHQCRTPGCETLTLVQHVRLKLATHACDSAESAVLDGAVVIRDLTTVFGTTRPHVRGVHGGHFYWTPASGGRIVGTLDGITNAGILRAPASPDSEVCNRRGVLTGRFAGTGRNVAQIAVPEFSIEAVYRLEWTPDATVQATAPLVGTLEGVLILPCR